MIFYWNVFATEIFVFPLKYFLTISWCRWPRGQYWGVWPPPAARACWAGGSAPRSLSPANSSSSRRLWCSVRLRRTCQNQTIPISSTTVILGRYLGKIISLGFGPFRKRIDFIKQNVLREWKMWRYRLSAALFIAWPTAKKCHQPNMEEDFLF